MDARPVDYIVHPAADPVLAEHFCVLECAPEGWVHHAITVPKAWSPIQPLPLDPDPSAPRLASLVVESMSLGDQSAVIVVGGVPRGWAPDARAVTEALAARDGLKPYRWNDEDDAVGGARAMVTDGRRVGAIRTLPLATDAAGADVPGWVYVACVGPKGRLDDYAGALKMAITSLKLHPFARWMGA